MAESIKFYKKTEPFYELSNFYPCKIVLDGKVWSCSEHYFQAMKFDVEDSKEHQEYMDIIFKADSPMKIFSLARQKKLSGYGSKWIVSKTELKETVNSYVDKYKHIAIRNDWNTVKQDIMYKVLLAKFDQHPRLKTLLLSTEDSILIEDSPRDSYWGIGKDGKGENHLGKILMKVRSSLK